MLAVMLSPAGRPRKRFHLLTYTLGDHRCLKQVHIAQHRDEFFAAEAGQSIGTASPYLKGGRWRGG